MNNIFLFDVDGTLTLGDIIPDSAILALKKLRENNDIVMLSTGRCMGQMTDLLNKIEIDGAICNNGAYAFINDEIIFESKIDKDIIKEMLNDKLHVTFLARNAYFRLDDNKIYYDFASRFNLKPAILLDYDYLLNNNIYSLGVQDYEFNYDLDKYNLNFIRVCDLGFDVINKGINKSSPIKSIRERYPNHRIISFGDNYNDLEMMKKSDISIAMKDSPKEVKDIANFVTLSPLEDGIEYALKNYLEVL